MENKKDQVIDTMGDYIVIRHAPDSKAYEALLGFHNKEPIVGDVNSAIVFTFEGMARVVAEWLGPEWRVVDVSQEAIQKAERLLAAIFSDDDAEEKTDG